MEITAEEINQLDKSSMGYAGKLEKDGKYVHVYYLLDDHNEPTTHYLTSRKPLVYSVIGDILTVPFDGNGYYLGYARREGELSDGQKLRWQVRARATAQAREVKRIEKKRAKETEINILVGKLRLAYKTLPVRDRGAFLGWLTKELMK